MAKRKGTPARLDRKNRLAMRLADTNHVPAQVFEDRGWVKK